MRYVFGLFAMCLGVSLMPLTCFGQQCDTSQFTFNPSTRIYYMPGGASSATSPNQCSCLQQQWNAINQQIQTEHQNCLNANQGQPTRPSGAYPGSQCSIAGCQSLHDALYTTMAPKEKQEIAACTNAVAKYQAEQQAQQAAKQQQESSEAAAERAAIQQRTQELAAYKQSIAAQLNANQDSIQKAAVAIQLLQRPSEESRDIAATQESFNPVGSKSEASSDDVVSANQDLTDTLNGSPGGAVNSGATDTATAWDPTNPPIQPAALASSDPVVQAEVASLQRLQQLASNNQAFQSNMMSQATQDQETAQTAALLGFFVAATKFPADTVAAILGLLPDVAGGEIFASSYKLMTDSVESASRVLGSGQAPSSTDFTKIAADSLNSIGVKYGPDSAVGAAGNYLGGLLGYETSQGTSSIANYGQMVGVLTQNPLIQKGSGALGAASDIVSSYEVSKEALSNAIQDMNNAATTIPQNYASLIAKSQAANAQIAAQEQAIYLQLQQLLQAQTANQPIIINLP